MFRDFSGYFLCNFFQVDYENLKKEKQVRIKSFSGDDKTDKYSFSVQLI